MTFFIFGFAKMFREVIYMSIKDFKGVAFDSKSGLTLGEHKADNTNDAQSKAQGICGSGFNCAGGGGYCGGGFNCAGG